LNSRAVSLCTVRLVQCVGDGFAFTDYFRAPFGNTGIVNSTDQSQAWIAPALGNTVLVTRVGNDLFSAVIGAVLEQAMQQEYVEEPAGVFRYANW
jgi:hypothetical protein